MSDFGMSATKVYANDSLGSNPAFWSVMTGGFDGAIEGLLHNDPIVTEAINAKFADPDNATKRMHVIDVITRATANCIGQKLVSQHRNPENDRFSILHALDPGTDEALIKIINDNANTDVHNAFQHKSVNDIIHYITRQTGRGLFQAAIVKLKDTATTPFDVLKAIKMLLPIPI